MAEKQKPSVLTYMKKRQQLSLVFSEKKHILSLSVQL